MATDPYKYFRVEARELLEQLGKGVLELEKGPPSADVVPRLLRFAHTLKGAARVVKQPEIADAAHSMEDVLASLREIASAVPQLSVDAILKLVDQMSNRLMLLTPALDSEDSPAARAVADEPFRTVRADVAEMDALLDGVTETHVQLAAIRRNVQSLERASHFAILLTDQLGSPRAMEMSRYDGALNRTKTGSLADELRSMIVRIERSLTAGVEQMDRELNQVRDAAEQLRLVPAAVVFSSLERTARDTAQALGKRVVFEGKGHEVRLDAHVLAVLQGALVQLVRNSVAHGIESEGARRAAGKSPEGRLRVEISRRGKRVAFVCADDGRGVDVDAIRQAAQRKGLLAAESWELSPGKLLQLLLEGGISTSGSVTEVSGRGIGLDIVREAAERLGGEVSVDSKAATGTTVEIVVPVSLSSLDVLTVEASGICVAIPLDAVRTTLRIKSAEVTHAPEGESILYEGMVIPFMPLECALKDNGRTARMAPSWSAVVIHKGAALAAVGVDRLLGTANVILRPPPEFAHADPIVAGAFLDAQGDPQIVLDAEGLIAQARRSVQRSEYEYPERLPVLVIDDSLTTRMLERSILEAAGYEVDVATSGEEALEKACRRNYALFLVDVEMPGMDGFTFVERAQSDPKLRHVPAVMVTSRASPEDRKRGQDAGARAYIVKSEFDQTDLLEKIRGLAA